MREPLMRELNIGCVIAEKRREKNITQDELADYIGITKASVSKWETGQSYPEITLLPKLAAFFNISVDELMAYQPQLSKNEIRKLYDQYCNEFSADPFDEVLQKCRHMIRKYYSCFPFLLQMGMLFINHNSLAKEPEQLMSEAQTLFKRIKLESGDAELSKQAHNMDAFCDLALGNAVSALRKLEGNYFPTMSTESLLAAAYQMTGDRDKAKITYKAGILLYLQSLIHLMKEYMLICIDEPARFYEVLRRVTSVANIFSPNSLYPLGLDLYAMAAYGCAALGDTEKTLEWLRLFLETATSQDNQKLLQFDDFFAGVEDWVNDYALNTRLPRNMEIILQSMSNFLEQNPAFAPLKDNTEFRTLLQNLKERC